MLINSMPLSSIYVNVQCSLSEKIPFVYCNLWFLFRISDCKTGDFDIYSLKQLLIFFWSLITNDFFDPHNNSIIHFDPFSSYFYILVLVFRIGHYQSFFVQPIKIFQINIVIQLDRHLEVCLLVVLLSHP